jgi:hypothetical protein
MILINHQNRELILASDVLQTPPSNHDELGLFCRLFRTRSGLVRPKCVENEPISADLRNRAPRVVARIMVNLQNRSTSPEADDGWMNAS